MAFPARSDTSRPIALRLSARTLSALAVASSIVYIAAVAVSRTTGGANVIALFGVPVGVAAWAYGLRGGTLLGAIQALFLIALLLATGSWSEASGATGTIASNLLITNLGISYLRSLIRKVDRRAREAEALGAAAAVVASGAANGDTLRRILDGAIRVTPARIAVLALAADEGRSLVISAAVGETRDCLGQAFPIEEGVCGRAFRTRIAQRVTDVAKDPDYVSHDPRIRSALAVPVVLRGSSIGVLYVADTRPGHFTAQDAKLMRAFADHSAVAIDNGRQLAEAQARERALTAATDRFSAAFRASPAGLLMSRLPRGEIVEANDEFLAVTGLSRAQVLGRTTLELGIFYPEVRDQVNEQLRTSGRVRSLEVELRGPIGDARFFLVNADVAQIDGEPHLVSAATEITVLKRAERDVRAANERAAAAFKANPSGIMLTRLPGGDIVDANDALLEFAGKTRAEVIGRTVVDLGFITAETRTTIFDEVAAKGSIRDLEIEALGPLGPRYFLISAEVLRIGDETLLLTAASDITSRKRAEKRLEHLALYDVLTDLPNRTLFRDRLEQAIAATHRAEGTLAVLLVDIDRFKEVNDTLGHDLGDQLLMQVASRLRSEMKPHDTIGRLGGDTFALIVDGGGMDVLHVARSALASFDRPFAVKGHSTVVSASIGISLYPQHGGDAGTLLRHADVAVTAAKQQAAGVSLYEPDKDPFSPERLGLTAELRAAIAAGQLVLHFQPIVSVASKDPGSAEALVRWLHPTRGMIPPGDFVPAAERTGLIKALTEWVLASAAKQAAAWAGAGRPVPISVNISMRNLVDPRFGELVAHTLAAYDLDPALLRLEITESVAMADPESTLAMLTHIRDLGVRLSIDDFGTGYSSLAYLRRLPVDTLKIDRAFVTAMRSDPRSASIVRGATELAHALGLVVVAEGVEDEETLRGLRELGCDFAQGYHFGRPMPATDFAKWHEQRRGGL